MSKKLRSPTCEGEEIDIDIFSENASLIKITKTNMSIDFYGDSVSRGDIVLKFENVLKYGLDELTDKIIIKSDNIKEFISFLKKSREEKGKEHRCERGTIVKWVRDEIPSGANYAICPICDEPLEEKQGYSAYILSPFRHCDNHGGHTFCMIIHNTCFNDVLENFDQFDDKLLVNLL